MQRSERDNRKLLQVILDIGVSMTKCGAENARVEDSLYRMCKAYGFVRYDIFALPSNIQATIETENGGIHTQIRHIENTTNDFYTLDYLNNLSRYACAHTPGPDELKERYEEVMNSKSVCRKPWAKYVGSILGATGFCVFFKGTFMDAVCCTIVAILVAWLGGKVGETESNPMIYNFIVSLIAEFAVILLVQIGIGDYPDRITEGVVMLVVSGLGVTNGIRDILHKDIMSGFININNAILGAAGIAAGIALPILLLKGVF